MDSQDEGRMREADEYWLIDPKPPEPEDRFRIWLDQARMARLGGGWRIGFSLLLSFVGSFLGAVGVTIILMALLMLFSPEDGGMRRGLDPALSAILGLASFGGLWISVLLVRRLLHKMPLRSVWGWSGRLEWRPFWGGALCSLFGFVLSTPLFYLYLHVSGHMAFFEAQEAAWSLSFSWRHFWLALALLTAIFIQSSGEEALFRGHMTQILAARWRPLIWLWAGLPTLIFSLLHIYNSGGQAPAALMALHVGATAVFGLLATAMTRVEGGISAAVGLHVFNNSAVFMLALAAGELDSVFREYAPGIDPPPAVSAVMVALYHLCSVVVFTTRFLPFGRWIGLRR